MIMGELQGRVREITGLKERIAEVEKNYEGLQKQSKQGEQLMERQVRDLTQEKELLNIRLHSEIAHRKKLHNELEDLKGKIRVFCRVRPLTK